METNKHVQRRLAWKDLELDMIFAAFFGTHIYFTFFKKPTAFIHSKTDD
jgi:hypothetical protein